MDIILDSLHVYDVSLLIYSQPETVDISIRKCEKIVRSIRQSSRYFSSGTNRYNDAALQSQTAVEAI